MNKTANYMNNNGWKRIGTVGTAGLYTNGKLYVMCNGGEWFVSRTQDASERWAKGWKSMLPAFRFADAQGDRE